MAIELHTSEIRQALHQLHAGLEVRLSGPVYTARDAAHRKIFELIKTGRSLPFELQDATIYYSGPTPPPPSLPVGSCGPTTSGRMDVYTPTLLELGLVAMIGKGHRNAAVVDAMIRHGAVYFGAIGGAGALAARSVVSATELAFPELGCESVKLLEFSGFPVYVAIDCLGHTIFEPARSRSL